MTPVNGETELAEGAVRTQGRLIQNKAEFVFPCLTSMPGECLQHCGNQYMIVELLQ